MENKNVVPIPMDTGDARTVLAAGAALCVPVFADDNGVPFILTPDGYKLENLEKMLPEPIRWNTTVNVHDVDSLILYVNRFKDADSRIYYTATEEQASFTAVLNDHAVTPRWRDHRAVYSCPFSPEWKVWKAANNRAMTHIQFAEFIDANQLDIVLPPSAEMLEISRSMKAHKKVNWLSDKNLANGSNQLNYQEEVEGAAGKNGQLRIPEDFTLGISVFVNGERFEVPCKLRYRIDGNALAIWYAITTPHLVIKTAVKSIVDRLAGLELPIIYGTP